MPLSGAAMISENTAAASSSRCTVSLFFARRGARAKVVIKINLIFYLIPIDRACPRGRWIDVVFLARAMPSPRWTIRRFVKRSLGEGYGRFRPATSGKTPCSRATFKKRHLIGAVPSSVWFTVSSVRLSAQSALSSEPCQVGGSPASLAVATKSRYLLRTNLVARGNFRNPLSCPFWKRAHLAMITMRSTENRGAWSGSVTAKVLHDAQCPVWTRVQIGEPEPAGERGQQTVLCAVGRSPESTPVMQWAAQFAEQAGAVLKFVHVIPDFDDWLPSLAQLTALREEARHAIESLQRQAGVRAPSLVMIGKIGPALCEQAKHHKADYVIIGRGRLHDTPGRLGKQAYDIIRHAPCPVISV